MAINYTPWEQSCGVSSSNASCRTGCTDQNLNNIDVFGCPSDRCPDFTIRRHDTKPEFKVLVEDCDGPLDLTGLVLEVNMWLIARLKKDITESDTYFQLANNVGFDQIMVGDVIIMDQVRRPEHMLVEGFDEQNKYIKVQRGYNGTTISAWKKGTFMRVFRILNGVGETEMVFEDVENLDGTVTEDENIESYFIYEWKPEDTCLPGCFWLEFKLIKMKGPAFFLGGGVWYGATHTVGEDVLTGTVDTDGSVRLTFNPALDAYELPFEDEWRGATHTYSGQYFTGSTQTDGSVELSITGISDTVSLLSCGTSSIPSFEPSFTSSNFTPSDFGCSLPETIEWIRRFPTAGEGFLIQISCSPTTEF